LCAIGQEAVTAVSRNATETGIRLRSPVKAKVIRYRAKNTARGSKAYPLIAACWLEADVVVVIQDFVIRNDSGQR
jgi:hypothetical protein